jgi:adenylate cyclase
MTAQSTTDFVEVLRSVKGSIRKLMAGMDGVAKALKAHGIRFSDEMDEVLWDVQQNIEKATLQGQDIHMRLEQLQDLVRTSALVSTSLELDQVVEGVMDTVIQLSGAERAYLMLFDKDSGVLEIHAARNWDHQTLPEDDVVFSRSIVELVLNEGVPIITTNAQQDERFQSSESVVSHGLRSILCIPLILVGRIVGVMYADNRLKHGMANQGSIPLLAAF